MGVILGIHGRVVAERAAELSAAAQFAAGYPEIQVFPEAAGAKSVLFLPCALFDPCVSFRAPIPWYVPLIHKKSIAHFFRSGHQHQIHLLKGI